ncbi:hypothetical protein JL720_4787 [Aureococcus anophagefferens]|nr:hypothetical protein JL720_4787 [Aureococcus anophagefferens]
MRICVYASSSTRTSDRFMAAGRALGAAIAAGGHVLVNGGGRAGGMGALNEAAARPAGASSASSTSASSSTARSSPARRRWSSRAATTSASGSGSSWSTAALIVMPGGVGTLDELWDAASLQQLGFKTSRPVVLVNLDGYYDATPRSSR